MDPMNELIKTEGRAVWAATRKDRQGAFHSGGACPGTGPRLTGGDGACHECESYFEDTLLELLPKWLKRTGQYRESIEVGGWGANGPRETNGAGTHGFSTGLRADFDLAR